MSTATQVKAAAKALVATGTAVVGSLAVAATDGHITLAEGLVAAAAGLTSLGLVYRVPNNGDRGHDDGAA